MASPPQLPPRAPGATDRMPHAGSTSPGHLELLRGDPRSSSTQSLVPSLADDDDGSRRTLLIIYIHGFYGNDQSFRSFPAHVHSLLRTLLADSHVIHSKIYPRYKTYKAIEVARDNFSAWLEPHESPTTDVILVGHSMGGLLAGEVVLMPNQSPYHHQAFKHKIIGTLSLDSPFLGLHPGIVVSGISSLFQPAPKSPDEIHDDVPPSPPSAPASLAPTSSIDSRLDSSASSFSSYPARENDDPHYDPPYWNDEPFRERPFIKRLANFASKHRSEGILHAVRNHVVSHLEFGGCLADYRGLVTRYNRLRALENVDELQAVNDGHPSAAYARVRFANYYTLSPGRPKVPKSPPPDACDPSDLDPLSDPSLPGDNASELEKDSYELTKEPDQTISLLDVEASSHRASGSSISTPRISVEAPADEEPEQPSSRDHDESSSLGEEVVDDAASPRELTRISMLSMQDIDPTPMEDEPDLEPRPDPELRVETVSDDLVLPPIPDEPQQPTLPDLDAFTDKDARKQAERESKRMQKNYAQAVKDRAKAIRERDKLLEKRRKKAQKDADKVEKRAQKEQMRLDKEEKKRLAEARQAAEYQAHASVADSHFDDTESPHGVTEKAATAADGDKPRKLRKFCNLPGKTNGARDATWVDVYMDGMDEVGAHCGLFAPGPHYEQLVGDVGSRIVGWIHDDMSKRAILEAQ
ncbi:catalytic protein [Purpureocillium lilacinum]|uniref:Catalytic protein n=1 Tax=Purpureocillium lilacinum TaxID=33203 RepID=A0A179GHQ9_PURLI|nr:catalytic protein [Purpureocillium lilacinum]